MGRNTFLLARELGTACDIEMTVGRYKCSKLPICDTTETRTWSRVTQGSWVGPTTSRSQPDTVAVSNAATP